MLNEAEKMKKMLTRVQRFAEFAKKAKTDSEKKQLEQDSEDLKQEIDNTPVDNDFRNSLLTALVSAGTYLSPETNNQMPIFDKIGNRVKQGIDRASDILNNITCIIVNNAPSRPREGVIGKGKLIDGNTFLEYADGGKLVYRADLGNENKSTYFPAEEEFYKNMNWDEAIVEIHPINNKG